MNPCRYANVTIIRIIYLFVVVIVEPIYIYSHIDREEKKLFLILLVFYYLLSVELRCVEFFSSNFTFSSPLFLTPEKNYY